ncbi:MAG TPA: Ldh family oxidoreductase [Bellilinea sp.]|nr:Ldh family oxidoreductase [Bellilinea sp.]
MPPAVLYRAADLTDYMVRFFQKLGVSQPHAERAAEILISADLRGVSSHGIIRLHSYYGSRILKGLIDPTSPFTTVRETTSTVLMDGGNGLGMVVSYQAMLTAIEKARQSGVAFVNVRNSNHYGIAGYYAMMALPHDMIGISFTNAQPLVVPTYGRSRLIGTNPIAVAAPALTERPYVLDMATSIVPIGKITVYDKAGEAIPEGWGVDKTGAVTTSPSEVLKGGALLPLGGSDVMRGYKGYGLGLMVDIFSGVLSGAAFGPEVGAPGRDAPANVGHFFAAVNISAFRDPQAFKADLDSLIHTLKEAPKAVGQERIYIHGEKEFELFERNSREGVPLLLEVVKGLREAGDQVGVPFDLQAVGETTGEEE